MAECKGKIGCLPPGGVCFGEGREATSGGQPSKVQRQVKVPGNPVAEGQGHWGRGPEV